jgi:hypothetical protein
VTVIVQDTEAVTARLEREGAVVSTGAPINTGLRLGWIAEGAGRVELIVEGSRPEVRQSYGLEVVVTLASACVGVQGELPPGRRRHTKPSAMNVIC